MRILFHIENVKCFVVYYNVRNIKSTHLNIRKKIWREIHIHVIDHSMIVKLFIFFLSI
jgi:hypothetical protein